MNNTRDFLRRYQRDFLNISCGEYTYGQPNIIAAKLDIPRNLVIGNYCSIASGCKIFIGRQGIHPTNTLTSFPLGIFISDECKANGYKGEAVKTSLDVTIGNDVWIGLDVTIMAGVNIGTGAVIAAGAIVNKDVPPYTIVGGVPAKEIRKRFPQAQVNSLLESEWWNYTPDEICLCLEGEVNTPLDDILIEKLLSLKTQRNS